MLNRTPQKHELIFIGEKRYAESLSAVLSGEYVTRSIYTPNDLGDRDVCESIYGSRGLADIILCQDDADDLLRKKLEAYGYALGENLFAGSDIVASFDYELFGDRKILCLDQSSMDRIIDIFPLLNGNVSLNEDLTAALKATNGYFVVLPNDKSQLKLDALKQGCPCATIKELQELPRPSDMFYQAIHAECRSNGVCISPFRTFRVSEGGKFDLCISAWSKVKLGTIFTSIGRNVWNSYIAKIYRLSIVEGTYCFCNTKFCAEGENYYFDSMQSFKEKVNDPAIVDAIVNKKVNLEYGIKYLFLGHDATCNLKCAQCRKEFFRSSDEDNSINAIISDEVIERYMVSEPTVAVAHGEYFVSKHYRKIVESMSRYKNPNWVAITTNGLLFNQETWEKFDKRQSYYFGFSIDAAAPEIYSKVRGGDFEKVIANLRFACELRKSGAINKLEIVFVVSALNYKDMIPFIEIGHSIGVDRILFYRLGDWGSMEYFPMYDIANPAHPLYYELLEIVNNPAFNAADVILCRNLAELRGKSIPTQRRKAAIYDGNKIVNLPFAFPFHVDCIVMNVALEGYQINGNHGNDICSLAQLYADFKDASIIIRDLDNSVLLEKEARAIGFGDENILRLDKGNRYNQSWWEYHKNGGKVTVTATEYKLYRAFAPKINNRQIAIWGAGNIGKDAYRVLINCGQNVDCFVDRNAANIHLDEEFGVSVIPPQDLPSNTFVVVAAVYAEKQIEKELRSRGYTPNDYILYYSGLISESTAVFTEKDNLNVPTFEENNALVQEECFNETVCKSYPNFSLTMETSDKCNLRCIMCNPDGFLGASGRTEFDFERIRFLLGLCESYCLNARGEPLIGGSFWQALDEADTYDNVNRCWVHTNGLLLDERKIERILTSKLKEISFSIDAASQKVYHNIRGAELEKVWRNIELLVNKRKEKCDSHLQIFVNMTIMRENLEDIPAFVERAASIGVDLVLLRPVHYDLNYDYTELVYERDGFVYNCEQQALIHYPKLTAKMLEAGRSIAEKAGIKLTLDGAFVYDAFSDFEDYEYPKDLKTFQASVKTRKERIVSYLNKRGTEDQAKRELKMTRKCAAPWREISIGMDGRVSMCCYLVHIPFGNIFTDDFRSIWNCQTAQDIRRDMIQGVLPELCSTANCPYKLDAIASND